MPGPQGVAHRLRALDHPPTDLGVHGPLRAVDRDQAHAARRPDIVVLTRRLRRASARENRRPGRPATRRRRPGRGVGRWRSVEPPPTLIDTSPAPRTANASSSVTSSPTNTVDAGRCHGSQSRAGASTLVGRSSQQLQHVAALVTLVTSTASRLPPQRVHRGDASVGTASRTWSTTLVGLRSTHAPHRGRRLRRRPVGAVCRALCRSTSLERAERVRRGLHAMAANQRRRPGAKSNWARSPRRTTGHDRHRDLGDGRRSRRARHRRRAGSLGLVGWSTIGARTPSTVEHEQHRARKRGTVGPTSRIVEVVGETGIVGRCVRSPAVRSGRTEPPSSPAASSCLRKRRPTLHVALADLVAQSGHPVAVARDGASRRRRRSRRCRAPVVVRVDEHRVGQFVGGAGELRQDEHAVTVDVGRGVLLGDEVHPVAERRHQHHVAGAVERDELVERQRLVEVVDDRQADPAVDAVDLADEPFDLGPLVLVVLDALAGRGGDLHHDVALGSRVPSSSSACEGAQAQPDALGVVEAVDTEQDHLGVAEPGADLARPLAGGPPAAISSTSSTSIEIGNTPTSVRAAVVSDRRCRDRRRRAAGRRAAKFATSLGRWKPTRSHPSRPVDDLGAPRQPREQFDGRERDVEEEPDRRGPAACARSIRGHELQVVVVDPHDGVRPARRRRVRRRSARSRVW